MKVTINVSNHHVHLNKRVADILFGENHIFKVLKNINQCHQFATTDTVRIKGPKGEISGVRILGPLRDYTQIEISKTDSYILGINPPIRNSGDLSGSAAITIIGPKGKINLSEGCILSTRHIHITPKQANMYGLKGKNKVSVYIPGVKGGILNNVDLKVSDDAFYEMHIDTDDANSHLITNGDTATIIVDK